MAEKYGINVYSEIGQLKTVLLHRPGDELANLSPDLLERLLFDDTPDLAVAQKEHDAFAKVFKDLGVEVLYIRLLAIPFFIKILL
ncbi:Arginine deiminase [Spiroplasma poulsonii]|uniref:Arginine deiminase n=1 Tax=Spiroplasma poulsonii TaxID=2138 RepID=A0A2P6FB39_9MOLU|nr:MULTISPECIES: arginine deiminase family protein [Spiroplasma]KAF0851084.1 Arginine deiminase [Spiroplasma poulsonii]PQM30678.1 Arginine deiminase [Spiroplasma poulsonii]PWF95660.1 Arginine deiminase [Spiroplasma poulsonii]PWF98440.1 Arginine deiminase [Spiroplasma poulsonii]